ncbi:ABC transporter substrate-binding protein [Candidatus Laterigemmans baculatus]|uniref:ABC transporter substrate-binding protein n=1 Tax=Candidatus Laterigemmans baculatus TaxID=2770505 RepID=UPI0013DC32DC|nr:ABC transporter substrate-binding protein [Candidatus Laterigemmans baculatus]
MSEKSRRVTAAAVLFLALLAAGCNRSSTSSEGGREEADGASLPRVTIQLNWYPESEHGGVYAAQAAGLYSAAGVDVAIRPGGQGTRVAPELAMGRIEFAFANADDVVLFRQEGVDVVAVLAAMQNHPRCILVRADSRVESFEQLRGMTLQRQAGRPFLAFLRSRGLLEGVREVPYAGSVAELVTSKDTAIQAYSFAEPLLAEQQGVEVRTLMLSDLGWNPYSSVLVTTGGMIREQPDLVRRVVSATQRGWQQYLEDPAEGNAAILAANRHGMTAEVLEFGSEGLRELALPEGFSRAEVGKMTLERWQMLIDQMAELELVDPAKVQASDCFTTEFLTLP